MNLQVLAFRFKPNRFCHVNIYLIYYFSIPTELPKTPIYYCTVLLTLPQRAH